jgi:hypothetical protein
MADNSDGQSQQQPPERNPGLKSLDKLVGTWKVSGPDIDGQVIFEWMEGGFFLTQRVDLVHGGHVIKGIEIIGYERKWGSDEPGKDITSHFFESTSGDHLEYVWEVTEDTLTIWGGQKGSPAFYKGTFSDDGNSNTGAWQWPGGGYESTMTTVKSE